MAKVSKKELAIQLYKELETAGTLSRKVFIEAAQKEPLNMTPAGASTYFSTCKNLAEGKEVKSYYKPASERAKGSKGSYSTAVDDSKEDAPLTSIVIRNNDDVVEQVHSFMTAEGAIARYEALSAKNKARAKVVDGSPAEGVAMSQLTVIHG